MLTTAIAIASMITGVLFTLVMIVFLFLAGANASPTAIEQGKWLMASVVVVQLISLGGAIALLMNGRSMFACGVGLFPVPYGIALVAMTIVFEW